MNYELLNNVVNYIENNLDEDIDFNELGKISGMNIFILERIFAFLTEITLKEYVKRRRLSKAYEEIKNTDNKIIDIAFKYQFNSSTSFNRAFKNLFGLSPSECRKTSNNYRVIPFIKFPYQGECYNLDYEVKEFNETKLYCYHLKENKHEDLLYKIRCLFSNIKKEDMQNLKNNGLYGIFQNTKNTYEYYLGSCLKNENLKTYTLKKGKYVIFKLNEVNQKNIVDLEKRITANWFPATNYKQSENIMIEKYVDDLCYILLRVD